VKVRQDAWSHEDDLLLAETVLRYIREGGTQLAAFDEAGDKLNRTSAACGFRWNAEIRKRYTEAIGLAKKQRKERKRRLDLRKTAAAPAEYVEEKREQAATQGNAPDPLVPSSTIGFEEVIEFLCQLRSTTAKSHNMLKDNESLRLENEQLASQNQQLEAKLSALKEKQAVVQEDYRTLLAIMQRAEQMVSLEEEEPFPFLFDETADSPIIQT
jgi:prespore-specific regulator